MTNLYPTMLTNMEWWSFSSNDEVNAVILSREFAAEMEKVFAGDLAESDQILREEWKKRSLIIKIREWFSHLFARGSDTNVENGFAQVMVEARPGSDVPICFDGWRKPLFSQAGRQSPRPIQGGTFWAGHMNRSCSSKTKEL